ncbi:uncharacterized protein [Panulirus ornatus]|uniref:uncharacterized protein isoform X2 n=1 Tax=Panulirus ornatus TaxID=150431 RepID=UPI003A8BCEED
MLRRLGLAALLLASLLLADVTAQDEENEDNSLDETPTTADETAAGTAGAAASGLFGPQLRVILGALENVDDMLRTTIPTVDRFQCLERLMCSLSSSQPEPTSPQVPSLPIFDPTFQQGFIQDPSAVLQGFPGFQQDPALQQAPTFQNPSFQPPPAAQFTPQFRPPPSEQFGQGSFQTLQAFPGGTGFQNTFPNFRENPESQVQNTIRRQSRPPVLRQRRPIRRRPQRRGFLGFLSGLGKRKKRSVFDDGKRKKRNVFEDLIGGFTSDRFLGLLDQMMTQYSFYPYTHAAYMGYTGDPRRCENLYPSCPTTPEEMIDVFNNIHRYFPGGIPFKDKLPWPLNILLP